MEAARRPVALRSILLMFLALAVFGATVAPAAGQDGAEGGSGSLEGTETEQDETLLSPSPNPCIEARQNVFSLRGQGTYHGLADGGPDHVVYQAEVPEGEELHEAGPLQLEVENLETYYHGPSGTHGDDSGCDAGTAGSPVPAEFRIFSEGNVHDGEGNPCTGEGQFSRDGEEFSAHWTLGEDCVVEGNEAGTPGSGVAPAGTEHRHDGVHEANFGGTAANNIRIDYTQQLVSPGLTLQGPDSVAVDQEATVVATFLDEDFTPVSGVDVEFTVEGPGEATPASGSGDTDADGESSLAFTVDTLGSYTVTASATQGGQEHTATHTVEFTEPGLRLDLAGPAVAEVGEDVTLVASLTTGGDPVSGVDVEFVIASAPGPTSGGDTVTTDEDGEAAFVFDADSAGTHAVRATASHDDQTVTALHGMEFRETAAACPEEDVPAADFTDRAAIPEAHRFNVDCAAWREIVAGFGDGSYGPTLQVRRDQMASFIARTLAAAEVELPEPTGERFADVRADSAHDEAIHRLAAADIVSGGPGGLSADSYGPALQVRRDQMASFMVRAAEFATDEQLASQSQAFSDVPSSNPHFANVNGAAENGLAQGFGDDTYRPASDVRRDQMGTFVIRLFAGLWEATFTQN